MMNGALTWAIGTLGVAYFLINAALPSYGQTVAADGTVGTTVTGSGPFTVTGGTQRLTTLFHSFQEFSPSTADVLFQLSGAQSDVDVVVNRVTGPNVSLIDGQLQLIGGDNPDFFLINPNGIRFGENSSLLLPGSFVASTAESVLFEDGLSFSSHNPEVAPLLTVSSPVGLQLPNNPRDIQVTDTGQTILNVFSPGSLTTPLVRLPGSATLEVSTGETLALVGGNVTLQGGSLRADEGRIELGGVSDGVVGLQSERTGWVLDYAEAVVDRNVLLRSQSAVDASGLTSQGLQLVGGQVRLQAGSVALMQVFGTAPLATLTVTATELVEVAGIDPASGLASRLGIENLGAGTVGELNVKSPNLQVLDGGTVAWIQAGSNTGSDVNLQISDSLVVSGGSPFRFSSLGVLTLGAGDGGNLNIATQTLRVEKGGNIGSITTLGTGDSGDVIINALESVDVTGFILGTSLRSVLSSSINSSTLGIGNAGRIVINAPQVRLADSGDIDSVTLFTGNAGEVMINAPDFVELIGTDDPSRIGSSGLQEPEVRASLGLPDLLAGEGGSVTITTPRFRATGASQVSVANAGIGSAGDLLIDAKSIDLVEGALLSASTNSGEGGNIRLRVEDSLLLRTGARIEAAAGGIGNGGNIEIQSPLIVAVPNENSDIIANAVQGRGGNIAITSQGILGLQFRDQLTSDNDITASSEFGVNGTVDINTLGFDPGASLLELPEGLVASSDQIAQGCAAGGENRFIASGRGGVPEDPMAVLTRDRTWADTRDLTSYLSHSSTSAFTALPNAHRPMEFTEAITWQTNAVGTIELVANTGNTSFSKVSYATCSKSIHK